MLRVRTVGVALIASVVLLFSPNPVAAASDLAGTWNSDSLRDNRVGYYLKLSPVPDRANSYRGSLRFRYQDGRRGDTVPVKVTVNGQTLTIMPRSGSFDRSPGALRASLSDNGGVITFTNCRERLRLVMVNDLASDCTFRPAQ